MKKLFAVLIIVIIGVSAIFAISTLTAVQRKVFTEKDFPLEIDLTNTGFKVGEKISLTATITNKCGENVDIASNGEMPAVYLQSINDTTPVADTTILVEQVLKANDTMSRVFEYEFVEPGTYILGVYYHFGVNGVEIHDRLDDIIIEVK